MEPRVHTSSLSAPETLLFRFHVSSELFVSPVACVSVFQATLCHMSQTIVHVAAVESCVVGSLHRSSRAAIGCRRDS